MIHLEQRVENAKKEGFLMNTREILEEAFDKWKITIGFGLLFVAFYFIFSVIVDSLLANVFGSTEIIRNYVDEIQKNSRNMNRIIEIYQEIYTNPSIIKKTIVENILLALVFPLGAGVVYCSYQYDKNSKITFSDFIQGFQGSKFIKLLILQLIVTIPSIVLLLVFYLHIFALSIPILLIMIYLMVALIFAGAFIIIDNASLGTAIRLSVSLSHRYFGKVLLLCILSFFISKILGFFLCCIGLIITLPFSYNMVYALYKATVSNTTEEINNSISEIGSENN